MRTDFLRVWRSSYDPGCSADVRAWIHHHRSFVVHGRTIEEWAYWMSWTRIGMKDRRRGARRRSSGAQARFAESVVVPGFNQAVKSKMKLVIMESGNIGWVHERWKPGDSIYLLKGCSLPVTLRPRPEGGFLVVGDAYVQGYMEGEVMKNGRPAWTDIDLH